MTQPIVKPLAHPVTDTDKAEIDRHVHLWADRLGLIDWRINRSGKKASKANMADVKMFYPNRMATYFLADDFGYSTPVTPHSLEKLALHEMLHVLLTELVHQTEYGIEGEALESAEHRVIHVLEKLLLKP